VLTHILPFSLFFFGRTSLPAPSFFLFSLTHGRRGHFLPVSPFSVPHYTTPPLFFFFFFFPPFRTGHSPRMFPPFFFFFSIVLEHSAANARSDWSLFPLFSGFEPELFCFSMFLPSSRGRQTEAGRTWARPFFSFFLFCRRRKNPFSSFSLFPSPPLDREQLFMSVR